MVCGEPVLGQEARLLSVHCLRSGGGLRADLHPPVSGGAGPRSACQLSGHRPGHCGADGARPLHQQGTFHPSAGGHAGREHPGGGPGQCGAQPHPVGSGPHSGGAFRQPPPRRAAVGPVPKRILPRRSNRNLSPRSNPDRGDRYFICRSSRKRSRPPPSGGSAAGPAPPPAPTVCGRCRPG